ncbi:MAG: LysR family transcriptional regulator [Rhodospirillales bacterium]
MRLTLRIDIDDNHQLGPGKARLLELIAEHGSITAAGRAMGMSYRRAWLLIDDLNTMFDARLVETRPGGAGGGGATLTDRGSEVLAAYRRIEAHAASAPDLAALQAHKAP